LPSIFATASQTAMSMVPMATERSPWPPGFSLVNMQSQTLCGSRLSPRRSPASRIGFEDARDEALAHQLPWP
jgi:hypothetical protein